MKPEDHPIHTRYPKGIEGQKQILPLIELHIQEPVSETSYVFDTMDASSDSYWIELKRRLLPYHWSDEFIEREGWLIPAVKILRARCETKQTRFYYFWDSDRSLWYWDFSEEELKDCVCKTPSFHRDFQPHYYIKSELWKQVVY